MIGFRPTDAGRYGSARFGRAHTRYQCALLLRATVGDAYDRGAGGVVDVRALTERMLKNYANHDADPPDDDEALACELLDELSPEGFSWGWDREGNFGMWRLTPAT